MKKTNRNDSLANIIHAKDLEEGWCFKAPQMNPVLLNKFSLIAAKHIWGRAPHVLRTSELLCGKNYFAGYTFHVLLTEDSSFRMLKCPCDPPLLPVLLQ